MAIPLTVGGRRPTMPSANSPYRYGSGLPAWSPQRMMRPSAVITPPPRPSPIWGVPPGGLSRTSGTDPIWGYTRGSDQDPAEIARRARAAGAVHGEVPGVAPPGPPFDWSTAIGGSWEVAAAEAQLAANMAQARQSFETDLRSGLVNLGYTGNLPGNLSQYIDKDTLKNAIANKYSTYAQIANQQRRQGAINEAGLAARGILRSGQTTKSATDVINAAEQSRYSALQDFLTGARSGLTNLGSLQSQYANAVMQARFAAAARLAQQYGMGIGTVPGAGFPGTPYAEETWDPASAPYGMSAGGSPVDFSGTPGYGGDYWQDWMR